MIANDNITIYLSCTLLYSTTVICAIIKYMYNYVNLAFKLVQPS